MKKVSILLCLILLILPLICSNIYATSNGKEIYDSVNIPEDELLAVKDYETDIVIKVYTGMYFPAFAKRETAQEIINGSMKISETYFVFRNQNYAQRKVIREGEVLRVTVGNYLGWFEDVIYENTVSYGSLFSSFYLTKSLQDLSVSEIYVLDGATNGEALFIYYVTNYGDYVYYSPVYDPREKYLMPVEVFFDFALVEYNSRIENPNSDSGASGDSENTIDISIYNLSYEYDPEKLDQTNNDLENNDTQDAPKKFNSLWIIVPITILTVSVIVIYCKKRKIY